MIYNYASSLTKYQTKLSSLSIRGPESLWDSSKSLLIESLPSKAKSEHSLGIVIISTVYMDLQRERERERERERAREEIR